MKIIEPSASIIEDELAALSIYQRIDRCANVCYQRPPKPTEDEAREFCRRFGVEAEHGAMLEMAQIHLVVDGVDIPWSPYIDKTPTHRALDKYVVSGSVRAFMESENCRGALTWTFLAKEFPIFFDGFGGYDGPDDSVRFATPGEIPWQHKHVAVRFVVDRATSHQLVRHRPCSFLQESQRYCRYEDDVVFIRPLWADNKTMRGLEWQSDMMQCEYMYRRKLDAGLKPQQARSVLPNSTKTELIIYASLPEWRHIFNLRCSAAADPEMQRIMLPLREEFKRKYPEAEW